jgi:hypothetical protein
MERLVKGLVVLALGAGFAGCTKSSGSLNPDAGAWDAATSVHGDGGAADTSQSDAGAATGALLQAPDLVAPHASMESICRADAPVCWAEVKNC